jgi:hypothetical protein
VEMRAGSRPAPAAVFLLAAVGICAHFATGSRSRSGLGEEVVVTGRSG